MTAIQHYKQAKAPGPFQQSPFKHGDRVKTLHGTGTIYQSGPYDSWVIFDVDWVVKYVRTEFIAHIPGRIEGARPGYPPIAHLEAAGYQVEVLIEDTVPLHRAHEIRDTYTHLPVRVAHVDGVNGYTVVSAVREEPEQWVPVGLG